jgi:hypothetical protein
MNRRVKLTLILVLFAARLAAQSSCSTRLAASPIAVGSEWERYLRTVQVLGVVPLEPWTLRGFSSIQTRLLTPRDSLLPWRFESSAPHECRAMFMLPARTRIVFNSSFPFGWNDGAVWAGRGLTVSAEGGVGGAIGPLHLAFAPLVFVAQNARAEIAPNGQAGPLSFADWRYPTEIDLPQRFGSSAYWRLDPGQSEARVDISFLTAGFTTANEQWGPAIDHPVLLGNNAAGFPRIFAGTSHAVPLWRLGSVHGRVFYGRLSESAYSVMTDSGWTRMASGITGTFQPAIFPGLEVGVARFFHVLQPNTSLNVGDLIRPFGALFKVNQALDKPSNQLASVFARLVLPHDGVEVYGELGREDYNWDLKEFWQFLDHGSAYLIGARKAWKDGANISGVRAEILNSRVTHIALSSTQAPIYTHTQLRQGHTNHGQALGSIAGFGGGASILALDRYSPDGRLSLSWERIQFGDVRASGASPILSNSDVAHVWRAERLKLGTSTNLTLGIAMIYELNRRRPGTDAFGLQLNFGVAARTRATTRPD